MAATHEFNYKYLLKHFWYFELKWRRLLVQTPFFIFCINNGFKDWASDCLIWDISFGFVKIKKHYTDYEMLTSDRWYWQHVFDRMFLSEIYDKKRTKKLE